MHGNRAVRTIRAALIALIGALFMSVGAVSANAGGSDHANGLGHQKWASDMSQQSSGEWDSNKSDSESWSGNSESDNNGKDCKKNESSAGEKTGEQAPTPSQGETGGEQGGEQKGEHGGEQKGGESQKGEHGKKEEQNQGEHGKKEQENQGGTTPTQAGQTTPAVVTTPVAAPTPAPVQAQQAPAQGGEVQGETQETPQETAQGGVSPNRGGRVLAENETTKPAASERSLAFTGFDVRQLALLGVLCIAGSALLLRRTRRS
jgi:hypothetical protein